MKRGSDALLAIGGTDHCIVCPRFRLDLKRGNLSGRFSYDYTEKVCDRRVKPRRQFRRGLIDPDRSSTDDATGAPAMMPFADLFPCGQET